MPARFRWNDFVLDLDAYRLDRGGVPLPLEPKAFNLLALMVQRPGHLFTKQEIFDNVWPGTAVTDHALTRIVAQIRRALKDEAREARYLETVPTRGYRWICEVEQVETAVSQAQPRRWSAPFVTALGLSAVLALAVLAFGRPGVTRTDAGHGTAWPVQLTTNAGLDLHPALSPQGDAVALVSDRSGSFEIVVRALDAGATETPLTADGGQNVQPTWSPDGRFIAYHSYRHGGIWVVPSRGGTPRQIVSEGSRPAWSPDGASIAYQSDEHTDAAPNGFLAQSGSMIRMVSADGGAPTDLTRAGAPAGGHAAPSWSPDGRYICFSVFDAGRENGLWLLRRDTGETRILHRGDDLYESVFSRDGSSIYVAGGDALISLLAFDAANGTVKGGRDVIPVPGVPGVRGVSISADGTRLAFAGLALNSQIWAQPVTADGTPAGPPRALTSDTSRRNSVPVVSPDCQRVAYMSARRGERPNVWIMDVDGGRPVQLTSDNAFETQPEWSADGARVAFHSKGARARGNEDEGLIAIDVTTRQLRPLLSFPSIQPPSDARSQMAEVRLSGSGTRLAFTVREANSGRRAIYVTPLDAIMPRRLTGEHVSAGYPAWSPDERLIAAEIKDGSSMQAGVIDVESGTVRRLTNSRGQTWVRSWSPDGRRIAAAVLRAGQWSLRALDVNGGEREMTPPAPSRVFVRYPAWSPRGDLVVYERAEMVGNIWTLQIQ